jgi:carboxymethylenebutenolidase
MEITTERVEIPLAEGGTMGGYLARPSEAGSHPAVLVFMEIFGINSHIRDVTERIAREGYAAFAPDVFHRTGPGVEFGYDDEGFAKGFALLNQLKSDEVVADAGAAIAYLRGREDVHGDRIGCMGFCIGGHLAYLTACETDVKATASFYGGGIAAPEGVEAIRGALADAGVRHDTVVYPGAPHGFHCDQRDSYQAKAAGDAWERVKTLFRSELGRG